MCVCVCVCVCPHAAAYTLVAGLYTAQALVTSLVSYGWLTELQAAAAPPVTIAASGPTKHTNNSAVTTHLNGVPLTAHNTAGPGAKEGPSVTAAADALSRAEEGSGTQPATQHKAGCEGQSESVTQCQGVSSTSDSSDTEDTSPHRGHLQQAQGGS